MAGSALFSPPLTAKVEPDSTLGKGSEAREGRGQPVLGGVELLSPSRAGVGTGVPELEGSSENRQRKTLHSQKRRPGPGRERSCPGPSSCAPHLTQAAPCASFRAPKAGETEEAGPVPTVVPLARPGHSVRAAKTVFCPFSSLDVGAGGCGHPLPSSSHTSVIHPLQSPLLFGRGLVCFLLHSSPICIPVLPTPTNPIRARL